LQFNTDFFIKKWTITSFIKHSLSSYRNSSLKNDTLNFGSTSSIIDIGDYGLKVGIQEATPRIDEISSLIKRASRRRTRLIKRSVLQTVMTISMIKY